MDRPYLDKISTAPHVPNLDGQTGYTSTDSMPDMSHTGIQTKIHPYIPSAVTPSGKITNEYRIKSYKTMGQLHRENLAANSMEITFKRSHKQFIDKVLCQMEDDRLRKNDRTLQYLKTNKEKLGFSENFGETDMNATSNNGTDSGTGKIRVINRLTLFKSLLAESEAPQSVKRFGKINSPPRGRKTNETTFT
eukprot:gene28703-37692_t